MDVYGLMDLAAANGLAGVEVPGAEYLFKMSETELERVRDLGQENGLYFVLDGGVVDVPEVTKLIKTAETLGARTVRVTASNLLSGDRRTLARRWPEYLAELASRLRSLSPLAEASGVKIAVENHQDLASEELAGLCSEVDSESVGATLDAVNPLAVAEEPLEYARRLGTFIKHVHLKDYRIYATPEGFRLVRCPIGVGVLDVPAMLSLLSRSAPGATVAIELAALEARHVRFLEDDFWSGYPPRSLERILPVLRLREKFARPPDEEWRTPWELGGDHEALAAYEMGQFRESLDFLRGVSAKDPAP